jgi:hypothetical protein
MLAPITKRMTDRSNESEFQFVFFCDICHSTWDSIPLKFSAGKKEAKENQQYLWEREHEAAYERANREAILHFNRCPICKRWVCDECFCISQESDACKECSKASPQI